MTVMQRNLLVCLLLTAATLAIFSRVLSYDFVNYDDPSYVTGNLHVTGGLTLDNLIWAFGSFSSANWHPLTWLSHMADCQMFGLHPAGHHLVNVLLHAVNALLLFLLFSRATGAFWKSAFVAALFALHPLHVESVAWVAERKDVLSALFWMLTLMFYLRYTERPGSARYLLTLLCFALGLMAKPMLVTLPFVLLLLDYWPLARFSRHGAEPATTCSDGLSGPKRQPARVVLEKAPFLVLSAASCVVTFFAQQKGGAVGSIEVIPLSFRFGNALIAYVRYLGKMIWPSRLAVIYPLPATITVPEIVGAALLLTAITVLVVMAARKHPYLLVGWLWYIGTLVPVIGLVQVGKQAMADRYSYIPLIGLFIMIAWGIPSLLEQWRYRRIVLAACAGVLLPGLMVCTWRQLGFWKNSITLFTRAVEAVPDNGTALVYLGRSLAEKGRSREALPYVAEALRLFPNDADWLTTMGALLAMEGRTGEAISYFTKALRGNPGFAEAHHSLGNALMQQGRIREAIDQYTETLRLQPNRTDVMVDLAQALLRTGRVDEAMNYITQVVREGPDSLDKAYNLAIALADSGRMDEAIAHLSELAGRYGMPEAHHALGIALVKKARVDEAIVHFEIARRLKPEVSEFARDYEAAVRLKAKGR
jgi:protein O-mannosyl-transferase